MQQQNQPWWGSEILVPLLVYVKSDPLSVERKKLLWYCNLNLAFKVNGNWKQKVEFNHSYDIHVVSN